MGRAQRKTSGFSEVNISMPGSIAKCSAESRSLHYHLTTLFLFTRSDFKTVIVPQSVFALSLVFLGSDTTKLYEHDIRDIAWRTPSMLAWLWLHLLVEVISNQSLSGSIIEDTINKPWRPLPAGRLTVAEARNLIRVTVVVSLAFSSFLGNLLPSTTLMTLTWLYNDLDGSSTGPLMRNTLNAAGLACFGWGAVSVLLATTNGTVLRNWLLLIVAVISTTIHIQDLADEEGDKARGRRTAAIIYGENWTCWSVVVVVIFWSVVCPAYWRVPLPYASAPLAIALIMSAVVLLGRSQSSDELGLRLWCFWVTVVFLLPPLSSNSR